MKDPSALSSINVNKYFPQPRSIRIKDGKKKRQTEERGKINWSRALLKRGWGGGGGVEGVEGGKNRPVKLGE